MADRAGKEPLHE